MEVKVTKDKVLIVNTNYIINQGEFDVNTCNFVFSEEYTQDLVKKAEFVSGTDKITIIIQNNTCDVPYEMLNKDEFELRVYAFKIENEELILRYSPTPTTLYLREGSFKYASGEVITPSEIEQIEQEIQDLREDKQDKLISGENIKTINNQSILGSGNLVIEGISVDYEEVSNKPKINDVELIGNKTSSDLGLQPAGNYLTEETDPVFSQSVASEITSEDITNWNGKADESDIPDVSDFITKDVDDLTNYTKTSELSNVATSGSYNDLSNKPTIPDELSDLSDDSTHRLVTDTEKSTWNNKSDFSGSYNDLSNKPDLTNYITKDVNDLTYYYTKTEVDGKVTAVYKYKGSVATYSQLPSTGLTIGDVYNVESDGMNYAWTGTTWDALGSTIDLSGYQTKIDSTHKLSSDLVDDTNNTNKFVTTSEKTTWNGKYEKPSGGIPSTDMSSAVQTSLGKADTALQNFTEQDPVFSASVSAGITSSDITNWNGKVTDASYVHTDNNYTTEEKTKLAGLSNYTLPIASANDLGGVKVGNNLSIDANGVLSASADVYGVYYVPITADYYLHQQNKYGRYIFENKTNYIWRIYYTTDFKYISSNPNKFIVLDYYPTSDGSYFIIDQYAVTANYQQSRYITSSSHTSRLAWIYMPILYDESNISYGRNCQVLSVTNTSQYNPTSNYHPATKKYVDDSIATQIGNINTILATLTTPSGGNS